MVLEVDPRFQQNPDALKDIYVKSSNGTQVPLSTFTHLEQKTGALAVNHQGQFPVVTLSFNLAPGVSLGDAVNAIKKAEQRNRSAAFGPCEFSGNGAGVSSRPWRTSRC